MKKFEKIAIGLGILGIGLGNPSFGQQKKIQDTTKNQIIKNIDTISHAEIINMNTETILKKFGTEKGLEIIRENTLIEINTIREKMGIKTLRQNKTLTKVAQKYAEYLEKNERFSHVDKNGVNARGRIKKGGYIFEGTGENIAMGCYTIQEVITGWMNSRTHKITLTQEKIYFHIGVGYKNGFRVTNFGGDLYAKPSF